MSVSIGESISLVAATTLRTSRLGAGTLSPLGARLSLESDSIATVPLVPPPLVRFRQGSFSRSFSASFSGGDVRV